jgi:transposase-like protein
VKPISYKRHRFPPDIIRQAIWLYYRFTMSLRDVEDLLAERGIDVTYETVRCWANKFGPAIAANIRRKRGRGDSVWHLDEMVVRISGRIRIRLCRQKALARDSFACGNCLDLAE